MTALAIAALIAGAPVATPDDDGMYAQIDTHLALTFGGGVAHGLLGPQAELRIGHVGLFAGMGIIDFPGPDDIRTGFLSPCAGVRALFGDGKGFYLSLHAAWLNAESRTNANEFETNTRTILGLTAGWRLVPARHYFFDLGLGAGIMFQHDYGRVDTSSGPMSFDVDRTVGVPDVDFAFGIEF